MRSVPFVRAAGCFNEMQHFLSGPTYRWVVGQPAPPGRRGACTPRDSVIKEQCRDDVISGGQFLHWGVHSVCSFFSVLVYSLPWSGFDFGARAIHEPQRMRALETRSEPRAELRTRGSGPPGHKH